MYLDGEIPDYRFFGKLNPDKPPETPDLSGLTSLDILEFTRLKANMMNALKTTIQFGSSFLYIICGCMWVYAIIHKYS